KTDLWVLPVAGDRKPVPFAQTSFFEGDAQFSPDGSSVAYDSDESGRMEVYVRSFSDPANRIQVSSGGGFRPRWRGDGKELFYFSGGRILSVDIQTAPALLAGNPKELFRPPPAPGIDYAVTRAGQRFFI